VGELLPKMYEMNFHFSVFEKMSPLTKMIDFTYNVFMPNIY